MTCHDLQNQNALVTGGANGIGEAIVRAFHQQGAHVGFCDCDAKAGRALADELGSRAVYTKVDLVREKEIRQWIHGAHKKRGAIRVLVNNAARDSRMPMRKTTTRFWDELFALNLRAYFLTCREASPFMPRGGSIINFGSITFNLGYLNLSAYVATKGGIIGLTRSLARELGQQGIRVNAISPGWVMTKRQIKMHVTPAAKKWVKGVQCLRETVEPHEMAKVVLFLASDASSAITGQNIIADKGWVHL